MQHVKQAELAQLSQKRIALSRLFRGLGSRCEGTPASVSRAMFRGYALARPEPWGRDRRPGRYLGPAQRRAGVLGHEREAKSATQYSGLLRPARGRTGRSKPDSCPSRRAHAPLAQASGQLGLPTPPTSPALSLVSPGLRLATQAHGRSVGKRCVDFAGGDG